MSRRWLNVELPKATAGKFKEFCRDMHIKYEASEADNMIHFEVFVGEMEIVAANDFLMERC